METKRSPITELAEALYIADEFIRSVTAWTGHEDDRDEALTAIAEALARSGVS